MQSAFKNSYVLKTIKVHLFFPLKTQKSDCLQRGSTLAYQIFMHNHRFHKFHLLVQQYLLNWDIKLQVTDVFTNRFLFITLQHNLNMLNVLSSVESLLYLI